MHDIAQKQIFFLKLPELDLDPDLVVKYPDPAKRSRSGSGSATLFPSTYQICSHFPQLSFSLFFLPFPFLISFFCLIFFYFRKLNFLYDTGPYRESNPEKLSSSKNVTK
jgi:hypothetical protein